MTDHQLIIVMGVSGSGKSTIGKAVAERLGLQFFDGDDFHSEANVQKMASGQPLDDNDRRPWLESINKFSRAQTQERTIVVACSALKDSYRMLLSEGVTTTFVYLRGSQEEILTRMHARKNHFMPVRLLETQFAALEEPDGAVVVNINQSIEKIVKLLEQKLRL